MLPPNDSKRQLIFEDLTREVDRERQSDRDWFRDNPKRTIRVRRAFPAEARRSALLSASPLPADARRFTLARRLTPRGAVYMTFMLPRGFTLPLTERGAHRVWEALCASGATIYGAPMDQVAALAETVMQEAA